jgi:hypothetical protein
VCVYIRFGQDNGNLHMRTVTSFTNIDRYRPVDSIGLVIDMSPIHDFVAIQGEVQAGRSSIIICQSVSADKPLANPHIEEQAMPTVDPAQPRTTTM